MAQVNYSRLLRVEVAAYATLHDDHQEKLIKAAALVILPSSHLTKCHIHNTHSGSGPVTRVQYLSASKGTQHVQAAFVQTGPPTVYSDDTSRS